MKFIYRFFPLLLITNIFGQIDYSIIQSDEQKLILDFNVNLISEDNLKPISIVIGIPNNEYPELVIEYGNNAKISENWKSSEFTGIQWINIQRLQNLNVATLQIDLKKNRFDYFKNIPIIGNSFEEDANYSIGVNLDVSIADVILNFRVNNLLHRLPIDGDYSIRTHELFNPVNSMISFGILWEFDD